MAPVDELQLSAEQALLGQLVGALSEGLLWCSYNDDEVLKMWLAGQINDAVEIRRTAPDEYRAFIAMVGREAYAYGRAQQGTDEVDWEQLLRTLYRAAGGWPTSKMGHFEKISELGDPYRWIANALDGNWPLAEPMP